MTSVGLPSFCKASKVACSKDCVPANAVPAANASNNRKERTSFSMMYSLKWVVGLHPLVGPPRLFLTVYVLYLQATDGAPRFVSPEKTEISCKEASPYCVKYMTARIWADRQFIMENNHVSHVQNGRSVHAFEQNVLTRENDGRYGDARHWCRHRALGAAFILKLRRPYKVRAPRVSVSLAQNP
ncbi:exported protein of unknown function [Denitratisoma oestradiolicum]|uniref:Uncharacterized protein n=1 Tax=Denitratisoma oestradiolicum TaxID=311182 RepID=A0A6S6Y1N4_9PROT|nr:exported protein of unknown function [Denitratisoma oestradiolicum]